MNENSVIYVHHEQSRYAFIEYFRHTESKSTAISVHGLAESAKPDKNTEPSRAAVEYLENQ